MSNEDRDAVEQAEDVSRDSPEPESLGWLYFWIAFVLFIGGQALYRLLAGEHVVGELRWWSDILAVVLGAVILVLKVRSLIRDRDERAKARAERWDPWD